MPPFDEPNAATHGALRYVAGRCDENDLLVRLRAVLQGGEPVFFMTHPESGESVLGAGAVCEIRTEGKRRFEHAADFVRSNLGRCRREDDGENPSVAPRFVGGFSFSDAPSRGEQWRDYPACWFFLPREMDVVENGRRSSIRFAGTADSPARIRRQAPRANGFSASVGGHDRDRWNERVEAVLERIAHGELEKAVLSRSVTLAMPADRDIVSVLDELRRTRPACHTFLVVSGDSVFFGSTPELLVRVRERKFTTQAIAGTAPRGRDAAEDERFGASLLASPKNRREQAAVVRGIERSISVLASDVHADRTPHLLRVPEASHLHTRVSGRLNNGESALEVAAALHPTPAVCGTPGPEAANLIEADEDRGWYAGGVGWLDGDGDGLFAVALRSGLIRDATVTLWAGAGIVAGSEAEAERLETDIKLRALRDVLDASPQRPAGGELEAAS